MSLKTEYEVAKAKLAEIESSYQLVKADVEAKVAKFEAELAALPAEIAGKAESEIAALYHKIAAYFGGHENVPADPAAAPVAPVEPPPAA